MLLQTIASKKYTAKAVDVILIILKYLTAVLSSFLNTCIFSIAAIALAPPPKAPPYRSKSGRKARCMLICLKSSVSYGGFVFALYLCYESEFKTIFVSIKRLLALLK